MDPVLAQFTNESTVLNTNSAPLSALPFWKNLFTSRSLTGTGKLLDSLVTAGEREAEASVEEEEVREEEEEE